MRINRWQPKGCNIFLDMLKIWFLQNYFDIQFQREFVKHRVYQCNIDTVENQKSFFKTLILDTHFGVRLWHRI